MAGYQNDSTEEKMTSFKASLFRQTAVASAVLLTMAGAVQANDIEERNERRRERESERERER